MAPTIRDPPGFHSHHVLIHQYDIDELQKHHVVKGIFTSIDNMHQYTLDLKMEMEVMSSISAGVAISSN